MIEDWLNLRPEQRSKIVGAIHAKRSPEEKARIAKIISEKRRQAETNLTAEQIRQRSERVKKQMANMTAKQKAAKSKKISEATKAGLAKLTLEDKKRMAEKKRKKMIKWHAELTPEQRKARGDKIRKPRSYLFSAKEKWELLEQKTPYIAKIIRGIVPRGRVRVPLADLIQETKLEAFDGLDLVKTREHPEHYIGGIARNLTIVYLKGEAKRRHITLEYLMQRKEYLSDEEEKESKRRIKEIEINKLPKLHKKGV